ncbi:hypothetical protein [Cellulomonas hominis]|uniref:hypothetical protein n=1 Tax=Cellulomonas hominis TaxID=156981 RepID=UPI0014439500|nr:hypothetical protein [Cellulomonas hominis]NKY08839.1 hypothetical protein [Cellulomonas hominis]
MTSANSRPVRVDPAAGEALESWIRRVADANYLPARDMPQLDRGARKLPSRDGVAAAGAWSGVEGPVTDLTLYAYPCGVRGRADGGRARVWRVDQARWMCPVCTPATGMWMRDWSLACHPLCLTCGSLLVDVRRPSTGMWRRADDATLAVQRRIGASLEKARVLGETAPRWRTAYRIASLIALTADDQWPPLPPWEAELRASLDILYRGWHRRPPADPAQAAWVVFEAVRCVESPAREHRLVAEGWDRLLQHPDDAVRRIGDRSGVLPERPHRMLLARPRPVDPDAALQEIVRTIRRLRMSTGLAIRHIPSWCITDDDFAPAERDWTERSHLAVVLYVMCSGRAGRTWQGERTAISKLLLQGLPKNMAMSLLRDGRGLAAEFGRLVIDTAQFLVDDGLVDYAERRALLLPMVRHGHVRIRPPSVDHVAEPRLADWIWVHATRGPVPESTWRTRAAVALDAVLDPETRMYLITGALADLDGEVLDAARSSTASGAAVAADVGRLA